MRSSRSVHVVWVVALLFLVSLAFDPVTSLAQAPPGPVQLVAPAAAIAVNAAANRVDGDSFCSLRGAITAGTVITVNTAVDGLNDGDGYCSLREAITAANSNAAVDSCPAGSASGTDRINFDIGTGMVTITLGSQLPDVGGSVSINGSTQPGFSGTPLVRIAYSGTALKLYSAANSTIRALDLSYRGGGNGAYGLQIYYSNNITVTNVTTANREWGVYVFSGTDAKVVKSDLRAAGFNGGYGLSLNYLTAGTLPGGVFVSGNRYGNSANGVQASNMSNLTISDGSLSGSNIIITDTSGLNRTSTTALYLGTVTNASIDSLDLSYVVGGNSGTGLSASGVNTLAVSHVTVANRNTGISIGSSRDVQVLNNDLRQAGFGSYVWSTYALYLSSITAGSLPRGVVVTGNTFGGSQYGLCLDHLSNQRVSDGSLPDSNVILAAGSGLNQESGVAVRLSYLTTARVEGLDLSYSGGGNSGYGLYADSDTALRASRVTAAGRSTGIVISSGQSVTVQNSNVSTGTAGGTGLSLLNSTNVTATQIIATNRSTAVDVTGGRDVRVTKSDLRNSSTGLYMFMVTGGGSLPGGVWVSGNRYGDGANGVQAMSMSNLTISDGSLPGSNVIITDTSGLNRTSGTALILSSVTNVTVDNLDLSYVIGGYSGTGLSSSACTNLLVTHVKTTNRNMGVSIMNGQDARVLDNDLRQSGYGSGYALSMSNVASGSLPGGATVTGNTFGSSQNGVSIQYMANETISDGGLVGSNMIFLDSCGLNLESRTPLLLGNVSNSTVYGVDLSYTGGGNGTYGLYADSNTNVTINRVTVSNRNWGIAIQSSRDMRVLNSDLRRAGFGSAYALYLYNVTAGSLPGGVFIRGNLYGDSENGIEFFIMSNLVASDGRLSGSNVVISDTSGLTRVSGSPIYVQNVTNATFDDLNLAYTVGGTSGTGLYAYNSNNVTVNRVTTANRGTGVSIWGGRDATVTNSNLRQCGTGLTISNVTAGSLTGGVFVRGNLYGSGSTGVRLASLSRLTISDGSRVGSNVIISDTSGLTNTSYCALNVTSVPQVIIDNLDFSANGSGSYGLRVSSCTNLTITNSTVSNRTWGIEVASGTTTRVDCTAFCQNAVGFYNESTVADTILWNDLIQGNSVTGLRDGSAPLIVAENNYWGSASGPSNLGGTGDSYQGNVDAAPFLTASPACVVIPAGCVPTAVQLTSFSAAAVLDRVLVTWETASEQDNVGFHLYRRALGVEEYTRLNTVLIPSLVPGGGGGASYRWDDDEAGAGVTYEYLLEAVDVNEQPSRYGPVTATAAYTIFLPLVVK